MEAKSGNRVERESQIQRELTGFTSVPGSPVRLVWDAGDHRQILEEYISYAQTHSPEESADPMLNISRYLIKRKENSQAFHEFNKDPTDVPENDEAYHTMVSYQQMAIDAVSATKNYCGFTGDYLRRELMKGGNK